MQNACPHCAALRPRAVTRRADAGAAILQALNAGPRTLSELAIGVYGYDAVATRRKVSANLKSYRDFVEPLGDGKSWRLSRHVEAAE